MTVVKAAAVQSHPMRYAPGLFDRAAIRAVVDAVALKPVNVLREIFAEDITIAAPHQAGVKRVSTESALYTQTATQLQNAAQRLAAGEITAATAGISFAELTRLIDKATRW